MPNRINKASLLQIYTDFCPQTIKSDGYHHYIILLQNYTELCFPCSSKFGVCRYFLSPRLPNFARTRNVCYRKQPTKCSTLDVSFITLIQSMRRKSRKGKSPQSLVYKHVTKHGRARTSMRPQSIY